MGTMLWSTAQQRFTKDKDYAPSRFDRPGKSPGRGPSRPTSSIKKLAENNAAISPQHGDSITASSTRAFTPTCQRHHRPCRYQVANGYMSCRPESTASEPPARTIFEEPSFTAVINNRQVVPADLGPQSISATCVQEGIILNTVQDVLSESE